MEKSRAHPYNVVYRIKRDTGIQTTHALHRWDSLRLSKKATKGAQQRGECNPLQKIGSRDPQKAVVTEEENDKTDRMVKKNFLQKRTSTKETKGKTQPT